MITSPISATASSSLRASTSPACACRLDIFFRFINFREFDVSEMSMGKYAALTSQGDPQFSAIPVFPSRIFRHSSIYVRSDGKVNTPADLAGKRVGLPEWAQTAAVYSRGALVHQYGVDLASIHWVQWA